ncbi:KTSC domain-containing protein [Haoranjiania flava]
MSSARISFRVQAAISIQGEKARTNEAGASVHLCPEFKEVLFRYLAVFGTDFFYIASRRRIFIQEREPEPTKLPQVSTCAQSSKRSYSVILDVFGTDFFHRLQTTISIQEREPEPNWKGFCNASAMPSTVIKSYHYNAEKETLTIVYVSGSVYKYLKVPAAVFQDFKNAFSKGKYLNQYIKPNFAYEKLDE